MPAPKGNQYAKGCKTSGRPTKYTEDMPERVRAYFANPTEEAGDKIATRGGCAVYLGIGFNAFSEYMQKYEEFAKSVKDGMAYQERQLTNLMADKETYTAGQVFVAKNILGWSDKQDHSISGPDGGPVETKHSYDLSDLEPAERDAVRAILSKRAGKS